MKKISKETLKLLNDGSNRIISKIVTGDETCIPFSDVSTRQEGKVWIFEDDPTPTMVKRQRETEKKYELVKAIKLEGQKAVTANWYTTKVLQKFSKNQSMLHHDNASSHTAGLTVEFLKQKQVKVVEYPPHSPDLEEIGVAINAFFSSIPRNEWFEAFNLWKIRLQMCIDAEGDDYSEHS
ncbi:UNVERIFIED_CONTAM: hypothetical protein NCL1_43918 [Trichonephila clavipes]